MVNTKLDVQQFTLTQPEIYYYEELDRQYDKLTKVEVPYLKTKKN